MSEAGTERRVWELSKRLTTTQLTDLYNFMIARKGRTQAFYFYDSWETVGFAYDVSGSSTVGRYKVRFDSEYSSIRELARHTISLRLIEVA
jgi:hypothetical protein